MASQPPQAPSVPATDPQPASPVPAPDNLGPGETDAADAPAETNTPQDEPVWPTSPED
jgi:hypothetical protein